MPSESPDVRFYHETSAQRSARVETTPAPAGDLPGLLIVGSGMIGREHMRVAQLLGRARVQGLYDTSQDSLELAQKEFSALSHQPLVCYPDLDAACADPAVDIILVCTPNFSHWQVVQQVARCGKPLFIEKPMTTSLEDARRLVELADDYPAFVQVGMQYRYKAQYVDAFHAVRQQGALGAVKTIAMSEYRPPFLDKVEQWNKFNEYSGGTLVEKCCHYFDLINLMAEARPLRVYASGGQAVNFRDFVYQGRAADIDDHAYVIIDYDNGIRASFALNMFSQELYEELVVSGDNGRLLACEQASFKPGRPSRARLQVEVSGHAAYDGLEVGYPARIERSGHHGATYFEHEAMLDQLQGRAVDCATPHQGLWAILVATAAQESMARHAAVEVAELVARHGLEQALGLTPT